MSIAVAINEGMIVRHKPSETVDVLAVDTVVELQRDQFWIFDIHGGGEFVVLTRLRFILVHEFNFLSGRP